MLRYTRTVDHHVLLLGGVVAALTAGAYLKDIVSHYLARHRTSYSLEYVIGNSNDTSLVPLESEKDNLLNLLAGTQGTFLYNGQLQHGDSAEKWLLGQKKEFAKNYNDLVADIADNLRPIIYSPSGTYPKEVLSTIPDILQKGLNLASRMGHGSTFKDDLNDHLKPKSPSSYPQDLNKPRMQLA